MELAVIQNKIYEIRGHNIMLDFDLAELYEVETRVLKQAVRRNIDIFPEEFMFQLTREEYNILRSQVVTLKKNTNLTSQIVMSRSGWGGTRHLPYVFTEHGVTMLANVLKSKKARMRCMAIVRAFISMKHFILSYKELADKIALLEQKYNKNFRDVYEVLDLLLNDKKVQEDLAKRKRIGFKIPKKNKKDK